MGTAAALPCSRTRAASILPCIIGIARPFIHAHATQPAESARAHNGARPARPQAFGASAHAKHTACLFRVLEGKAPAAGRPPAYTAADTPHSRMTCLPCRVPKKQQYYQRLLATPRPTAPHLIITAGRNPWPPITHFPSSSRAKGHVRPNLARKGLIVYILVYIAAGERPQACRQ